MLALISTHLKDIPSAQDYDPLIIYSEEYNLKNALYFSGSNHNFRMVMIVIIIYNIARSLSKIRKTRFF